jgi:hypothetical protein
MFAKSGPRGVFISYKNVFSRLRSSCLRHDVRRKFTAKTHNTQLEIYTKMRLSEYELIITSRSATNC